MYSLLEIEYKDGLFLNDQSKDEYSKYLIEQLEYNLEKWQCRYSMNEHMLSIQGSAHMLQAIIEFIKDN